MIALHLWSQHNSVVTKSTQHSYDIWLDYTIEIG